MPSSALAAGSASSGAASESVHPRGGLSEIWRDLGLAVTAGVAAGIVLALLEAGRRWVRRRCTFGHLTGEYSITRKLAEAPEADRACVTVKGKILTIEYVGMPPGDTVSGKIAMSEELTGRGNGYYDHLKGGQQLWGFWDVQLKGRSTILVHTTYADPADHRTVTSAFVWERIAGKPRRGLARRGSMEAY